MVRKSAAAAVFSMALRLAFAQSTTQEAPSATQPTLKQTVRNVLVDVVITDKNGQPVRGLGRERFQVMEDGVPQQVSFFEEHQAPAPVPAARPLQLPPDVYSNFSTTPDNGPALVLLMDALNTPAADQVKVRLAMMNFLRQVPEGMKLAIFTLNERLRLLQGFSTDPATLKAALDSAAASQKQSRLVDNPGHDSYADAIPKADLGGNSGDSGVAAMATGLRADFAAHEESYRTAQRAGITLDAMRSLATYLSAIPGRKNLVWFSGSFPLTFGARGHDNTLRVDNAQDFSADMRKVGDMLAVARVVIYPVSAGGPASSQMYNLDMPNNGSLHNSANVTDQQRDEALNDISLRGTMDTLAGGTGGRAFYSSSDLGATLRSISQLSANYYTLAYTPRNTAHDGRFRKLTVKVDSPKVRIDYRSGYFADDPDQSGVDKLLPPTHAASALLRGAPISSGILFKVRVAPKTDATRTDASSSNPAVVRYSINWVADVHAVNLPAASNGLRHGGLGIAAVAYDIDGKVVNSVNNTATLILEPGEYQQILKSGLQFHQELDLPRGPVYLRLAIVDDSSDKTGVTEIPLIVAARATAQP